MAMREANWDEIFQRRNYDATADDDRIASGIPWEDWLTFAIASVMFMAVVTSVDSADWVRDMPSLYPVGFAGLITGYLLSRVRLHELLLHPVAVAVGAGLIYLQALLVVDGGSALDRTDIIVERMRIWWSAVTLAGISNDNLPVILLLLILTFSGAYVSSWAAFRWRNAWLAVAPGGFAIMWNISFIPGQFSYAFVVFLFAAVLLVMRLHLSHRETQWERDGVRYPEFISLSVLHATFWVTIGLLVAVWLLPLADKSETAQERWEDFTSPVTRHFTPLARVFISVNAKKPISVHNLEDALPFQGRVRLSGREAIEVDAELSPEMAAFLRQQSFDEYTSSGWKVNVEGDVALEPGERSPVEVPAPETGQRTEITVNVTVKNGNNEHLFSIGQPLSSDRASDAELGGDASDVLRLDPRGRLRNDDSYRVTGSVVVATPDQLRAAGTGYPDWVVERYLQLPDRLPERVRLKAEEVTAGAATPYDQAVAVEDYVRSFPVDFDIDAPPPGQDTVDYFLFDLQRGYFDYHASAMAVLLRTLGVPARVSTGYVVAPMQREGDSNTFSLTERQAFAWPEVYFPGVGWVEFSPTPNQPRINRPGTPAPTPSANPAGRAASGDELGLGNLAEDEIDDAPLGPDEGGVAESAGGGGAVWPALLSLAGIGIFLALLAGGARFAWGYGLGGLPRPAQMWEKAVRLAALSNARPRMSETPREYAARLAAQQPDAGDIGYLAAAYERTRFGHKRLSEDEEERLDAAWPRLRNALLRRILPFNRDRNRA
ncbi:MAG TPA: transglutaminase domain-containing protein [Dehalococcoidia bacterium]|nr:transglutaminase domain-containing protein [Dehalococcoidia bacterium]